MEQHQQVHKPKNHSCPLCGVQRFRSQANAVQHVEAGACPNCPGREAARNGVYNFVARNQETRHMLSSQPQLEYTGSGASYDIPERPYKCNLCERNFKDLGGMMQHQEYAHRMVNRRLALR
jgi:Zn-finger nucleic acid-binding protein